MKVRFDHTDDSRHNLPVFDNVLNRQFETAEPDHDWVARHDLCSHLQRLTVLGRRTGFVFAQAGGLDHGARHAGGIGVLGFAENHLSASTNAGPDYPFRPRQPACQPELSEFAGSAWFTRQHEP